MAPPRTQAKNWHNEAMPCQKVSEVTSYHPVYEQKCTKTATVGSW